MQDIPGFLPENIVVTNCVIASNCNPIKLGTSSYAGFRNVAFSNIVIRPTPESNIWDWSEHYRKVAPGTCTGLAGIAVECVDGGTVENISFDNIIMEGVITPIFVCLNHRHGEKGVLRDLKFRGITAKANGIIPCLISGVPGNAVEDILLRDITVEQEGGEEPAQELLPENLDGYPDNRMYGPWNPAGGLYIPAHVDKHSYSMLSNLGFMPDYLDIRYIELSKRVASETEYLKNKPELKQYKVFRDSDAHYLGDLSERINSFNIDDVNEIFKGGLSG